MQKTSYIDITTFLAADFITDDILESIASQKGADIPEASDLPKYITNYIGSKQKLIDWIWQNTPEDVKTIFDAFGGSNVVGFMYKRKGLKVVTNDILNYSYHISRAIIENNSVKLSDDEIENLIVPQSNAGDFISRNFKNTFFTDDVLNVLDGLRANIDTVKGYKRDIALFALGKTCISGKGGFGHFSATTMHGKQRFTKSQFIELYKSNVTHALGALVNFRFLKATISHLHGDHLADYRNLFQYGPEFLKTVDADREYLNDCYATCADASAKAKVKAFLQNYNAGSSPATSNPDYGGAVIRELCLPVNVARSVGGDANTRVNNASVVTRIDVYGNSILICGDLEKEAWAAIINDTGDYGQLWRPFLSNVDILVAPHHGHRSGYSVELLNLAQPAVVLVSVVTRDPNVDTRYSQSPVRGMIIGGTSYNYISTRRNGHIKVDITPPVQFGFGQKGSTYWTFGDAALR